MVIKRIILSILLIGCLSHLSANEPDSVIVSKQEKSNLTFYAGINPMALTTFFTPYATFFGVFSGQEFGIALYGGMNFTKAHSLEMRLSTGPADAITWNTQLQLGYIWYPLEQFKDWNGGLCVGFMVRQFFWHNQITNYDIFSFTPELSLGWRFNVKSLAFDLRGGWDFASVSWANMPHTKTGINWTPFPYNLTFTFGMAWVFNSKK